MFVSGTANPTFWPETQLAMDRPEPGPERGTGLMLGDVTPGRKVSLGRLDTHACPFSGLVWTSNYSQSDARARDSRGRG